MFNGALHLPHMQNSLAQHAHGLASACACRVSRQVMKHVGGGDNLSELVGRAVKAGYKVYTKQMPAPLGGNVTEDALLR